jgi:ZIP family zinc transporter
MLAAFLWGALAASSLLVGYVLAERGLSNRAVGLVMVIGAVAYELVPEAVLGGAGMVAALLAGALAFFVGDWLVDHRGGARRKTIKAGEAGEEPGSGSAIFIGTLLDNIPESLVLGIGLASGGSISVTFLVAVFVSNLPEGIAGTLNLVAAGRSRMHVFWMWTTLVIVSAASAAVGYGVVERIPAADGRLVQAFAAGAMLTMLADAMMPEAYEHGGKLVGLLTALGFVAAATLSLAG